MSSCEQQGYLISEEIRKEYYGNGFWCSEDFWASFQRVVAKHKDKPALVDDRQTVTFTELHHKARQFGYAALNSGVTRGEVVVIHGRHCVEAVIAILGCAYVGLVPALLPAMFSEDQVSGILEHTNGRLLIATGQDKEVKRVLDVGQRYPSVGIVLARSESSCPGLSWSSFVENVEVPLDERIPMNPDDLMLLIFSSGTTGSPKGVMHSANTARASINGYAKMHHLTAEDVELVVTAFGFVGSSLLGFYLTLLKGCTSILLRSWDPEETLAAIQNNKVTHILLMPTHAIDILNSTALDTTDCSSLRRGVVAGIAEKFRLDAKRRFCATPFPMYGMSESPAHVTGSMEDNWEHLRTTEGRPLPGAEVLLCDEQGSPVEVNQPGNILVRGPNRFLGYYCADDLNQGAITPDGYFRTGDIGIRDENGCITFVSRSKDIIRRGGVTITPSEIEETLRTHSEIKDIAVIGMPDPRLGEKICACVIERSGSDLQLEDLTSYLKNKGVAQYSWPEMIVKCDRFPRTPSLKVQKNQLLENVKERLRRCNEVDQI